MNLADYLSELLGQHDEVSVPGLGYFVRTRVNASFNEGEARFYPPYHQVKFVPTLKEDDTFAQYVADKKNISLASSKYFVEKFISKLREDATRGKYLFSDLGSFQTEQNQLVFKPNDRIPADPAFYGYPPVNIYRQGQSLSPDQRKPVITQTYAQSTGTTPPPTIAASQPVQTISPPQYYEEEAEQKRGLSIWMIILIAVAVVVIGILAVFKFYPSVFERCKDEYYKITGKTTEVAPVIHREIKKDTVKKIIPAKDTVAKTVSTVKPDTAKKSHFEAISDEFNQWFNANARVKLLKKEGYNAYILADVPGTQVKVSVGQYPTYQQADSVVNEMLKAGKIKKHHDPIEVPNDK
jgi:hypothetical protein